MKLKLLKLIKSEIFWLTLIVLLGALLRFFKLGTIPSGLVNDEADFGYNAYSLIKTGKDEFGHNWPVIFQSFGDGKMPVYFYLTIPAVLFFGLTPLAVRFPSAFCGTLTIFLIFFLAKKIKPRNSLLPLLSALVLATLPWHIHFSRAAFEANVGLFFITLGTYFWFYQKIPLSLLSFTLSIFTYHAPRLFVPLWLVSLMIFALPKKNLKRTIVYAFFIVAIPWLLLTFTPTSLNRASGITIINSQSGIAQRLEQKFAETRYLPLWLTRVLHNRPVEYCLDFFKRYLSHFDSDFLFFQGDPNRPRYRSPDIGQALWLEWPLLFIGLYLTINKKNWWLLLWLLLAPVPAAITFETPSAIRSLLMIIPLSLIIASGALSVIDFIKTHRSFKMIGLSFVTIIFVYNLMHYLDAYFIHLPIHQPYEWQGGYQQLVEKVTQLQLQYEKVKITTARGTPYIYFLFFNQYDPLAWQSQASEALTEPDKFGYTDIKKLDNLYFVGTTCPANLELLPQTKEKLEDNVLYVCTEENLPRTLIDNKTLKIIDTIRYEDGETAFTLITLNHD